MRERSTRIKALAIAIAIAMATLGAGCGEKSEDVGSGSIETIDLALDFYVNPDHAGIYEAIDRGYFADAGLDVNPQVPSDPSAPIKEVAAGRVDLAISYEPEVLLARDQGLPVTAVGALVQQPLTSLISPANAGIADVSDLRGKTIATAGIPYQEAYLKTILQKAGLSLDDVNVVNVQQGLLPAVLSGRADAMLGGFLNVEGVDLALRGEKPDVVPVDQLGIPTYDELVLVANSDTLDDESETIRLFIAALQRGTEAATADPAGATKAIVDAGKGLDPEVTRAEIDKTLPLLAQQGSGHSYGYMDPAQWQQFARFFVEQGLIDSAPSPDDMLDNDFLQSQVPD